MQTPTLQNTVTGTRLATQARTFILLAGLTGLLVVIGGLIGGIGGVVVFLAIGVAFNFAMYWFSDRLALRMSGAKPLDESDDPELFAMVASLARRAQLPMPRLYVIPQEQPNAFATGRNAKNAAIAVTAGIRRLMPAYQLEGVLAHEFAHIKNRDILVQSVAAMIAGAISGIAQLLTFSFLFGGGDDDDSPLGTIGALAMIVLAPIAAMIIQLSISRQREYLADATGAPDPGRARPAGRRARVARARSRRRSRWRSTPPRSRCTSSSPLRGSGVAGLFATHPPIPERVRRLRALRV